MAEKQSDIAVPTRSPRMLLAAERGQLYARFNRLIAIIGPVGCGKSTLARMIHRATHLPGDFVEVSAGAVPDSLYSDFLFGHQAGAFTSATTARQGVLMAAAHGVLLLDDIAQMPLLAQAALLGVMDRGVFRTTGAMSEQPVTCRFIVASTDELGELVRAGRMLRDFASRIGEFVIRIPPLAERNEDILPIAQRAAEAFLAEHGINSQVRIAEDVADILLNHHWPENVRQLRNVIECATAHALVEGGVTLIRAVHLPDLPAPPAGSRTTHARLTADLVRRTVHAVGGNKSEAARYLRVHRNTIGRYLGRGE